jgi:hypothetical protein
MAASSSHAVHLSSKPLSESQIESHQTTRSCRGVGIGNHGPHNARFHGIDQACPTEVVWCRGRILDGSIVLTAARTAAVPSPADDRLGENGLRASAVALPKTFTQPPCLNSSTKFRPSAWKKTFVCNQVVLPLLLPQGRPERGLLAAVTLVRHGSAAWCCIALIIQRRVELNMLGLAL